MTDSGLEPVKEENIVECRACLQEINSYSIFYNLFDCVEQMGSTIAEKLSEITHVQISEADELPKVICDMCYTLLQSAHSFTVTVRKTDQLLRQKFVHTNQQESETVWPKPIQISSNIEIKEEVLTEEECLTKSKGSDEHITDLDIKPEPNTQQQDESDINTPKINGSDTDSEYESNGPGPPTKKKLRTEIVHKKCVTTYSRQDFNPSETQSTDNESLRGLQLQIIGDIVIEHDNNQMEVVDNENPTIYNVQKPRHIIGVRLNEAPKTAAERAREFRARKALLKQQSKQQQESDALVEISTEDIRCRILSNHILCVGPSEDNQVPGPSEIRTIEKRAKSAEATRQWRERNKGVSESPKKQAKTAAQRMREYRARKKSYKTCQ